MYPSIESWNVIIVGAGFAGLKAALELQKAGKRVLILEAQDRVGGRAKYGEICGQAIDTGGQWLGAQQHRLRALAQQFHVQTYPQYIKGKSLLCLNNEVSQFQLIPKLPLASYFSLAQVYYVWQRDMKTLPVNQPWLAKQAQHWDSLTLDTWLETNIHNQTTREFTRLIIRAILCIEASQTSYLFFLECLRQGQGIKVMADVQGGAQQDKFLGGAWQIAQKMSEPLKDCIVLNSPVLSIQQGTGGVEVKCKNQSYKAEKVIITAPPQYVAQIEFTPQLPIKKQSLLNGMAMGNVIKFHIAYPTPFWRHKGLNGSVLSPDRHIGLVFDQSPDDEHIGIFVGLIEGHHAVSMAKLSQEERKQQVISDLTHYFGSEAKQPLEYVDYNWDEAEWTLGGYAAHMKPGILFNFGEAIREPFQNIHWAGTETATEFMGYYEGALESANRVTKEILEAN